ncbi:MAG TPA: indole-3-glycerol phosphate synthase TrpC [Usitatibacteraceae bacterium]|nr:indole-3-glycerol phosphate synthase TrpC [Usitatibacteraceae bacterium]
MPDILQQILATKRGEVEAARQAVPLEAVRERAAAASPPRDFAGVLQRQAAAGRPAIIAEIKRASPSAGEFRAAFGGHFDPAEFARGYAAHGATCLSVLTDRKYFKGDPLHLAEARSACSLPVLRKDFLVDPYQIFEARAMGADAVLFIMGTQPVETFQSWEQLALGLGMSVLAESHHKAELMDALQLKTPLIGINNRDLTRFQTDVQTTLRMQHLLPADRLLVTESGIENAPTLQMLWKGGIRGFLVGGALMAAPDPGKALAGLMADT